MRVQRFAFASLAVGLLAPSALAQVPAGGEFQVNTYTTGSQTRPAAASHPFGRSVVVWMSLGQDGSNGGIFGQRYRASGALLGAEFRVNTHTANSQNEPTVAADPVGGFVVAWDSQAQDGSGAGVFARRYAPGSVAGPEIRVNSYTFSEQAWPSVTSDSAGNFVVAWSSHYQDGSLSGVFAQRFDASGVPRGGEFRVNSYTTSHQILPAVASDSAGNFVVVWQGGNQDGSGYGVFAQRFDASGVPRGGEFRVNTTALNDQKYPSVAADAAGRFVVAWQSFAQDGGGFDIFAQRYDATGTPRGGEFRVNAHTTSYQFGPSVSADAAGAFVVAWHSANQDGRGYGVFAQRYDASGVPRGGEFQVNTYTTSYEAYPSVSSDILGNFVVAWQSSQDGSGYGIFAQRFGGLFPKAPLSVDAVVVAGSDGNSMLEPGETVEVKPSWWNYSGAPQTFAGTGVSYTGPAASGVSYSLADGVGSYGTVPSDTSAECSDCYRVGVGFGGTRPATHWDTALTERITPDALGQTFAWPLHVGDSFGDVPRTSPYYRFVEALLHYSVTGGCGPASYCPASVVTREQLAVFVLVGVQGSTYSPPVCGTPVFGDVPATSPYCRWIEELSRRGVVGGCGGGNYCPASAVTREQMPVFVLLTLDPTINPPACGTPMFADVPASSPFCRWIEELARQGVVSGCGGGNYCPADAVTREQMAVFIAVTFGLSPYGP